MKKFLKILVITVSGAFLLFVVILFLGLMGLEDGPITEEEWDREICREMHPNDEKAFQTCLLVERSKSLPPSDGG